MNLNCFYRIFTNILYCIRVGFVWRIIIGYLIRHNNICIFQNKFITLFEDVVLCSFQLMISIQLEDILSLFCEYLKQNAFKICVLNAVFLLLRSISFRITCKRLSKLYERNLVLFAKKWIGLKSIVPERYRQKEKGFRMELKRYCSRLILNTYGQVTID